MMHLQRMQAVHDLQEQAERLRDAAAVRTVTLPPLPKDAVDLVQFMALRRAARVYEAH